MLATNAARRVFRKLSANTEFALCMLTRRNRLSLPPLDLGFLYPGFDTALASISRLPRGEWSLPACDLLVMCKLLTTIEPMRVVEFGSYRGYTARAMIEHMPPDGRLVTVDIDPDHGEAYRGSPVEARIDRRVGAIALDLFRDDERGSFDLVFVDADHSREAVERDTEVALQLVRHGGLVLWHDYNNWGYFSGLCGVPEALNALGERLPMAHVSSSNMVIHSPSWSGPDGEAYRDALRRTRDELARDHWDAQTARQSTL